ncbi:MAG: YhgE/Pip domain-containing protein [Promicromonosporaceae bacterium]|nr:YhgE/Pip domain-containing protein [Promicromonosporaceae bacterium]
MNARTTTLRPVVWRVAAVALLPLLVIGLLLAALWNPASRLDTVRAAIVNLDQPVTVNGQLVPLGRQLAAGLVSGVAPSTTQTVKAAAASTTSYQWEITNAATARSGLADGTYAAVITIPKGFSAAATSFSSDPSAAHQATIDVATPPGGRVADAVLARVVAATATSVMSSSLTQTYVDNVLVGFNTLADQLGKAADGATQLKDGATSAADGATQLADGAAQLKDGATSAADGAAQLADGARQAATGAGGLASGASSLADGAGQLASGASQVASGATASKAGADGLAAGAGQLQTQLQGAAQGVAGYAAGVQQVADGLTQQIDQLTALCAAAPTDTRCTMLAGLKQTRDALAGIVHGDGTAKNPGLTAVGSGIGAAATQGAGGLQSGAQQLSAGLGQLSAGAGQVSSGAAGLQGGARKLADGASSLSSGVGQVATGASGLASGVGQLATGAGGVSTGAGGLADGAKQLATGAGQISDGLGQAVSKLPSYSDGERATLASVVANPVQAPTDDTLDTGSTGPLFAVVALWLGALGLTTVVRPSKRRALGSTRGAVQLAVGDLAVPAAVSVLTGAVVGGILAGVEHLSPGGWAAAIGVGALVSLVFVALHQGFTLWLGDVARGISLLMAVLVIATGVIATVPSWLDGIADQLAIGAARRALVAIVVPGVGGTGGAVTGLVVWGVVGLALAVLATARARTTRVSRLLAAA